MRNSFQTILVSHRNSTLGIRSPNSIQEIMTGKQPFEHITRELAVYGSISRGEIPPRPDACIPSWSKDGDKLWELLRSCWAFEPRVRPGAVDVEETVSRQVDQNGVR
jgi:hypothetical protein